MKDLFYVVEPEDHWYTLCVKDTHYCVSCGDDLNTVMEMVYKYVRKYKTKDRLMRTLSLLSDRGKTSPAVREKRQKDYDLGKHMCFNSLVEDTVLRALKDNREDTPYNRVKKMVVGKVMSLPLVGHTPAPEKERTPLKKVSPLKVRRISVSV